MAAVFLNMLCAKLPLTLVVPSCCQSPSRERERKREREREEEREREREREKVGQRCFDNLLPANLFVMLCNRL